MLSAPQADVVRYAADRKHDLLIAVGAIRSGKSHAVALSFTCWLARTAAAPVAHAVVGRTQGAAWRNQGLLLMELLQRAGLRPAMKTSVGGLRIECEPGQVIWFWGAGDERARERMQGSTLRGLICDEAAIQPESAWVMATSRCTAPEAKQWCSLNPEGPNSWFRKKVLLRPAEYRARIVNFRLRDNPRLPKAAIDRLEASYTGHLKDRLIRGIWAGATGTIYSAWQHGEKPDVVVRWTAGVDWASSGTFAAVLIAHGRDGKACLVAERVHDGRQQGSLTDVEQVARTVKWVRAHAGPHATVRLWGDPSTPDASQRLFRRAGLPWTDGPKDVLDGIRTCAVALAEGRVTISKGCAHTLSEIAEYEWDERAQAEGKDKPRKQADHCMDAMRYAISGAARGGGGGPVPARFG